MTPSTDSKGLRSALRARLIDEGVASSTAADLIERLRPEVFEALAAEASIADSPLLDLTPQTIDSPDVVVVFAFGNRSSGGRLEPGPVNRALADVADREARRLDLPVVAQWEVADVMAQPSSRIGPVQAADGSTDYLSTFGVAEQALSLSSGSSPPWRRVAVVAAAPHAVRCCRVLERVGFEAGVIEHRALPSTYDSESGQPWTRDRATYLAVDLLARVVT